jgi:hypothetical protein
MIAVTLASACGEARSPHDVQQNNPLGPSFWLVPTPSEDTGLLGRTFVRPPDATFSLEEQSQPNPCEAELNAAAPANMSNHYENAIDVSASAQGKALLGLYGFAGEAASASHLLYKVTTAKKLTRLDTTAYVECCQTRTCGWGYVSALVYGEGEYVSARDGSASGAATYQLVTAEGKTSYKALDKKQIRGWLAAVVTAHDRKTAAHACAVDALWAGYECVSRDKISQARELCGSNPNDPFWKDNAKMLYLLKERQRGACRWLDEHELRHPATSGP